MIYIFFSSMKAFDPPMFLMGRPSSRAIIHIVDKLIVIVVVTIISSDGCNINIALVLVHY